MMSSTGLRILAVTAHPDDAEIYIWGSLCAWRAMGATLGLVVASSGEAGVRKGHDAAGLGPRREAEARNAAQGIGLEPVFLRLPDGGLAQSDLLDRELASAMAAFAPTLVLTHDVQDYHPDHRAVSQAVQRLASLKVPVLYVDTLAGTTFLPNVYVDTTAHISAKIEAIRRHQSQDPERFVRNSTKQSVWRAYQCNAPDGHHAEAFRFDAQYPFSDIRQQLPPAPSLASLSNFK